MLTTLEDFDDFAGATAAPRATRSPRAIGTEHAYDLSVVRRTEDGTVTLGLEGEIDLESASVLERALRIAEGSMPRRVVLDLAGLGFLDSTGVHLLIEAQRRSELNGHELVLTNVPAHAERLFRLCGISSRFVVE